MYLELDRLSKQFDGKYAVHDLSLGLEEGGLLCILGSSGCGKTTTLNMIGGFLKPDGGRVLLDRQDITALPPERRPVSTVFQSYGLFPHMSVLQNVTYGLKFRGYSRAEAKEKGRRYLISILLSMPIKRISPWILQICKYRFGINMRPLLSGVTISTSLTNCLKISWCLLFHLLSLLRSSFNSSFHTLSGYRVKQS